MKFVVIALAIVSLTVPALAQSRGNRNAAATRKTEAAPKIKADDKGYKAALDRLPAQKYDPWGTVRPGDEKKKP